MIRRSPRQLLFFVALLLVAGLSAFFLAAGPLRTEPMTTSTSVEASPDRPRPARTVITWTPTSVEAIVSPSETATTQVSFVSTKNIRRAEVRVSQELASIVRPVPAVLERVRKGQQRTIQIVVSPSATVALGTYTGTIQIVRGKADGDDDDDDDDYDRDERGKPLAQALPVVVNVWHRFSNPSFGLSFQYPAELHVSPVGPVLNSTVYLSRAEEEYPGEGITISQNVGSVSGALSDLDIQLDPVSQTSGTFGSKQWTLVVHKESDSGLEFFTAMAEANGTLVVIASRNTSSNVVLVRTMLSTFGF